MSFNPTASTKQARFTWNASLNSWNIPVKEWLERNDRDRKVDGLSTAIVVFNAEGEVLLVQRASTDSLPNRWEIPGGAADVDDLTVLHAACRELLEETGLIARHFKRVVPKGPDGELGQVFQNKKRTKTWCRFTFCVDVERLDEVRLDAQEHQDFVWASEQAVRAQKMGTRELTITHPEVAGIILEAFRLNRRDKAAL